MTTQATPNILITQTDNSEIHCFMLVVTTDEGVITLRFHARELVDLVHGIQLELLDWFGNSAIEALENMGMTDEANYLRKLKDGA